MTVRQTTRAADDRAVQIVVGLQAAFYLFTALALLFAPGWFFENIGRFPPFNRHYMGDLGGFLLALAVGLFAAARRPAQHATLIGVVALSGLLHLGNHLYDDILAGTWSMQHAFGETLPLALFAATMIWAWLRARASQ